MHGSVRQRIRFSGGGLEGDRWRDAADSQSSSSTRGTFELADHAEGGRGVVGDVPSRSAGPGVYRAHRVPKGLPNSKQAMGSQWSGIDELVFLRVREVRDWTRYPAKKGMLGELLHFLQNRRRQLNRHPFS